MTFRKNQSRENHIYYYTTKKHPTINIYQETPYYKHIPRNTLL